MLLTECASTMERRDATVSNAAAENITKEMPRESLLQKNCSEHIFSAKETKKAMKKVANLFSVKNEKKELSKVPGASDIYFTDWDVKRERSPRGKLSG